MMRRAVVTGVAGFIGSHLADSLLAEGWWVVGVDRSSPSVSPIASHNLADAMRHRQFRLVTADLTAGPPGLLDDATVVFHLAAATGVRSSWGDRFNEYATSNILATQRLMEACVGAGVPRVVIASSSSVYGNATRGPCREDDFTAPLSPYAVSKLAAERLACAYAIHSGSTTSVVALRYFTVYGPRQRDDMAIARMFRAVLTGEPMRLYGDGSQRRSFTYVTDVVRATIAAADCPALADVVNVAGGKSVSLAEVTALVETITGRPVPLLARDRQPGDVDITDADQSRSNALLRYRPRVRLSDGLRCQWAWLTNLLSTPGVSDDRSVC